MRRIAVSVLIVALFASLVGFVVHRRVGGAHTEIVVAEPESESTAAESDDDPDSESHADTTTTEAETEPSPQPVVEPAPAPLADPATEAAIEPVPTTDPAPEPVVDPAPTPEPVVDPAPAPEPVVDPAPTPTGTLLDRPLRVIATHWEVAAPIVLASADGGSLARAGLRQELRVTSAPNEIEEALARGGAEDGGADLAIVPMSVWVAGYEHLAALETEAFFVAAWSRGSQVFFSAPDATTRIPPSFTIAGTRGSPDAISLLTLLDEMGVSADRARFVASDDAAALFAASERESSELELRASGRQAWLSTADASRLSAWVVIAPRGFVRAHQPALVAWSSAWLAGVEQLAADVPAAARTIAQIEGAPPLVELLRRLGQIESAPLLEQAAMVGLSGERVVTLESMFRRTWAIERALGVLSGPAPDTAPIATGTLATLVRRESVAPRAHPTFRAPATPRALFTLPVTMPRTARDTAAQDALRACLAFAATVFPRSGLELVVTRAQSAAARTLVDAIVARDGLDPARLTITTGTTTGLRVLAPE